MKNLIILISLFFAFNTVYSQNFPFENFYIGISGGPSIPMSDFGSDDVNNSAAGFAVLGSKFEINAGLRLFNILDLSVMSFVNTNGTELDKFIDFANRQNPGYAFSADAKSWSIFGALGGLSISYPVPGGFYVDARVLGGFISIESPEILLRSNVQNTFLEVEGKTTSSFVYLTSAGARYPISDGIHLGLGIEYISAAPEFEDVTTTTNIEGMETKSTTNIDQSMNLFNVTLGFKFFLFQMFQ